MSEIASRLSVQRSPILFNASRKRYFCSLKLVLNFVGDVDAAEAAGCVDINSVFAFVGNVFAFIRKAAENEAGF